MADGYFPTLVSKDQNPNALANGIFIHLTDGVEQLLVNPDGSLNAVVTATDLDIRNLTFASDKVDVTGSSVTVSGTVIVTATDLDIRDLTLAQDAVKVSANTTANGPANPIYVQVTNAGVSGEVHDYNTATVAGGATSNHDYTVVTAFKLTQVEFACSGGGKVELQVGPLASLVSKWVGFVPKAGGIVQVAFAPAIEIPLTGTGTVRLIRTNREGASQDLYSTIVGIDA